MKILRLYFGKLRNAEHFQFFTEFRDLVNQFGAAALKILKFFTELLKRFDVLDESLVILQKSGYTEQMDIADKRRDSTFRGLVDTLNAALNHFNAEVVAAAKTLKIVFDTYGNLAQKPGDEETSGIYNLIQDLEEKYAAEALKIGAVEWIAELKANNETYGNLVKTRDTQSSEKPETKVKKARASIEEPYRDIIAAIESLAKLSDNAEEAALYKDFITKLNVIIERYKNRIAQREGAVAAAAAKKKSENDSTNPYDTPNDTTPPDDTDDDEQDDTQNEPLTPPSDPAPRPPRS